MPEQRRTFRLAGLLLVAASSAIALVAIEGALRLGVVPNWQYDRLLPSGDPARARHRLLILGDSYLIRELGLELEIEARLAPYDVSVLDLAVGGTGPFEYLSAMRRAGRDFRPDVVLLGYFAGNDLTDVKNHPKFASRGDGARRATGVAIHRGGPVFERSFLYLHLRRLAQPWLLRHYYIDYDAAVAAGVSPQLIEDARSQRINPWLLELALRDRRHLLANVLMETPDDRAAFEKVIELLSGIDEASRTIGAQLVMVVFPATIQVNRSHFDFFEQLGFDLDERTLDATLPQDRLIAFAVRRRIELLDLLPAMRARADEEFFKDRDDHLNARGIDLVARRIVDLLATKTTIGREGAGGAGSR